MVLRKILVLSTILVSLSYGAVAISAVSDSAPQTIQQNTTTALTIPSDLNSVSVYAYFRIGENDSDIPSISIDSFKKQINEITSDPGLYNVLSLDTALTAQKNHTPLPPRSIILTFEGTDASFYKNALPLLKQHNLPFTIFISPGLIDQAEKNNSDDYLHWADIRDIAKLSMASIGLTTYNYTRFDDKTVAEISADINTARSHFRENIKIEPQYFSYPFGIYTANFLEAVSKQEFAASFGQHSGVMDETQSRLAIPRFSMTEEFADIERFRMTSSSLPLPINNASITTTVTENNPPHLSFKIAPTLPTSAIAKMSCYATGLGRLKISKDKEGIFSIAFPRAFEDNKGRVNCTIPASSQDGTDSPRWRWLGFLFSFDEAATPINTAASPN